MKPRPFFLILYALTSVVVFSGCDDIIEPSISKATETLDAPSNGYQTNNYTVNFWWNTVDHALSYHLQVVTPNFANPGSLVLDTTVSTYKFSAALSPGSYQWRVMAENGSTMTAWATPNSFTILPGSLSQQAVQLIAPANNLLTNQSPYTFSWNALYNATQYQFQIDTNNFSNPNAIVSSQTISGTQLNFSFPKSQVYQWRVMAMNDTAQSQWSLVYQVTFNNTPPAQVALVSPTSGTTVPLPVTLQWNAVANAVKYKLYVYQSDGVTLYNSTFPMSLTTTSYSFNLGSSGNKIYWTVTAVDAEGNESTPAAPIYFTLQ